ncbi:MAG: MFS transporter [Clostridiales bacterium]|nr:MFS transporter [Clostridiales bacterium]
MQIRMHAEKTGAIAGVAEWMRRSAAGDSRRGLAILLAFTFVMAIGFDMIMPLVIGHYVNDVGFTATAVAIALAIRQFSQQGLALVGGGLADSFDIRLLIALGVLLRATGFAVLAFAESFSMLAVSMALIGLGGIIFEMPYQAAIVIMTTDKNRSKYYSLSNAIIGVAGAIGPLLGVALNRFNFKWVCFGASFCFLADFAITCLAMPKISRKEKPCAPASAARGLIKDRQYLCFVLFMLIFWLAASQIDASYPLKAQDLYENADGVGVMYAVYAAITAVFQYPLVSLAARKFSAHKSVAIGILIVAASLFFTAYVNSPFLFMAVVAFYAIGMALARPNQQNIAASMAKPRAIGMYLGLNSLAFAIGKGFGSILGGVAFDAGKKSGFDDLSWQLFALAAFSAMLGFLALERGLLNKADT